MILVTATAKSTVSLSCSSRSGFRPEALLAPGCLAPLGTDANIIISNLGQPPLVCGFRRDQGRGGPEPGDWLYQHHVPAQRSRLVVVLLPERSDSLILPSRVTAFLNSPEAVMPGKGSERISLGSRNKY